MSGVEAFVAVPLLAVGCLLAAAACFLTWRWMVRSAARLALAALVGAARGVGAVVEWVSRRPCRRGDHEWVEAWSYLPLNTGGRAVMRCKRCGSAR